MTNSQDKAKAGRNTVAQMSPANGAWTERYLSIRRLQGITDASLYN